MCNSILKRLSSTIDTQFRGKVQMALASVFPISARSGVNVKGLYNLNNVTQVITDSGTCIYNLSNNLYKSLLIILLRP